MVVKGQTNEQSQTQRDKINRMDFTLTDVVMPALESIKTDLKTVVEKDYVTEPKADAKYATKDELKTQKTRIDNIVKWVSIAVSAIIVSVIGIIINGNIGKP